MLQCPQCNSERLYKDGLRYNKDGTARQRWLCRNCGLRFSKSSVKGNITGKISETLNSKKNYHKIRVASRNPSIDKVSDSLPFFFGEDVAPHNLSIAEKDLNNLPFYNSKHQVCAQQDAKNLYTATEIKTVAGEFPHSKTKSKLLQFAWWMKKEGYSENTITRRAKILATLSKRGAELLSPETVKETIAKQNHWKPKTKELAAEAYSCYLKMVGGKWQPPKFMNVEKYPFVPTDEEVKQLIAGCNKKLATFLKLLADTGIRSGEAWMLEWTDFDFERRHLRVTSEKGGKPRVLPINGRLEAMLKSLATWNNAKKPFNGSLRHFARTFRRNRTKIAQRIANPRIKLITFHTLRHYKATKEFAKTKNLLHVQQMLGHRSIMSTMIYTHLIDFREDDFHSATAKTVEEAAKLVEAGFEYVCTYEDVKLFRKRK
jgi:integrase